MMQQQRKNLFAVYFKKHFLIFFFVNKISYSEAKFVVMKEVSKKDRLQEKEIRMFRLTHAS